MKVEIITSIIIAGIAVVFLNPGHLSMPDSLNSMLIVVIILAFLAFSGLVLKEKSSDERETMHIMLAGRLSYLVGIGVLIFGIVMQAFNHGIDPWLVIALCAMILSKLLARIYSNLKM